MFLEPSSNKDSDSSKLNFGITRKVMIISCTTTTKKGNNAFILFSDNQTPRNVYVNYSYILKVV